MSTPIPTLAEVCDQALKLPSSPALLPRMVKILNKEDSSTDEFEALIRLDTALASSVLRLANSAYMSGGRTVDDLSAALLRLGQKEIYKLAALSLTSRWSNTGMEGYGWTPGDFCRYSLCVAIACEYFAEQTEQVDFKMAYTLGLIHEIGKLAVANACGEHFPAVREHQAVTNCEWLSAEKTILGYNHAEVGSMLLAKWQFPTHLVEAVRHQQSPAAAPKEVLSLAAHLHAARYVAASIGAGVSEDGFMFEVNSPFLIEWGFSIDKIEGALPTVFDRATRILNEKLTHGAVAF